eukprot:CAMPEP_0171433860 /NCGR_PEP_ID=MMETSP0881-20121228/8807_1 /TAXON_ID=67004 /ORGANISM="Thalassiosira weissflogii, Strain CCMP1336" /LENGTH=69 /DNA_ID=CAMNT_0011954479 /DNA_START=82 /DNA_END=291 /DNA_ORIENTATION=+
MSAEDALLPMGDRPKLSMEVSLLRSPKNEILDLPCLVMAMASNRSFISRISLSMEERNAVSRTESPSHE